MMIVRTAVAVLVAVIVASPTGVASASGAVPERGVAFHLRLTKSEPARDQVVSAPTAIRLWFSMAPELAVTTIKLADAAGTAVALSAVRRGSGAGASVEADVAQSLAPGRYTVTWKTSSKDGHPMKGDFTFTVRAGAK